MANFRDHFTDFRYAGKAEGTPTRLPGGAYGGRGGTLGPGPTGGDVSLLPCLSAFILKILRLGRHVPREVTSVLVLSSIPFTFALEV